MEIIILICGKAEAGKTLSANIIKENLEKEGKRVLILSFAGYLKFIAKEYFKWNGKKDRDGRTLLQHLGTNVVRKKNPDFWVKTVYDLVHTFEDEFDYFILDDTRFPNEIDYFHERDPFSYVSVRVNRINFENSLSPEQREHPSETSLDDRQMDIELYSMSGRDNLENEILHVLFQNNGRVVLGLNK